MNEAIEGKLQDYQLKLDAARQELEAFNYSVSHDLRSPLQHITGFADLLGNYVKEHKTVDDKVLHYVQIIQDSTEKMAKMMDGLLDLSRVGREFDPSSRINLNELVAEIQKELAVGPEQSQVTWNIGSLPEVQGDLPMIKTVLKEFITNAVKSTQGKESAQISISGEDSNDKAVTIAIKDNGLGFDMEYVDKLFNVFQHLHSQEEFAGVGVGLAKVKKIMQMHDGKAWAEGFVGEGAAFYFSLPVK